MDFERLNTDRKELQRRNRGLGLAVGALAIGQILTLIALLNVLGTERTVIVLAPHGKGGKFPIPTVALTMSGKVCDTRRRQRGAAATSVANKPKSLSLPIKVIVRLRPGR